MFHLLLVEFMDEESMDLKAAYTEAQLDAHLLLFLFPSLFERQRARDTHTDSKIVELQSLAHLLPRWTKAGSLDPSAALPGRRKRPRNHSHQLLPAGICIVKKLELGDGLGSPM